jgi:exportin-1
MGIKSYVVQLVIKLSADENFAIQQKHFLTKLNETLICIVKQEWPHAWENFIPDICGSSKSSQPLCENNLRILNLLSEEVFDFGKNHMTTRKVARLKNSLNTQFSTIYELCDFIFKSHVSSPGSIKGSLVSTTLATLVNFLSWIPLGYIFETDLIQTLLVHFWDPLEFRIECVKCLNEIACLGSSEGAQGSTSQSLNQYQPHIMRCFQGVVEKIQQLPENIAQACVNLPGPQRLFWEVFHNQVALLLTGFLKHNLAAMSAQEAYMIPALKYLVKITMGPNEETFKICVEFWQTFSARIFLDLQQRRQASTQKQNNASPLMLDGASSNGPNPFAAATGGIGDKLEHYAPILSEVRGVLISKMAKPPEVTIKENEEGHIVRAEEEDTDERALYSMMREALIYLTHLNPENMEQIMLQRLTQECLSEGTSEHWSPTLLNRLCWAIGSISGAMQEGDEKRFLVSVIKDLLSLCEMKRGKENKAVVASNIMYVVGQYPRFLRAHWKFLKTVIFKLFEFMHETFPGVQEMAVDTFLKICQKCRKKFTIVQSGESMTFIDEMMGHIDQDIAELEHLHICTYFEAVGHMISAAQPDSKARLVAQLMRLFNEKWRSLLACGSPEALQDQQVLRSISLILRVNERMVSAVGLACYGQLESFYDDMLRIYKVCSNFISCSVAQQGTQVMGHAVVKLMRNVKRDSLRLVRTFVDMTATPGGSGQTAQQAGATADSGISRMQLAQRFIPPLLEPVLEDYRSNLPQARDAEVLDLLATLATRLSESISQEIGKIFEMVFECTLDMIKGDFQSYPDHRVKFYELLKAINANCFEALFMSLPEARLKLYVDSLIWALKHEQPQVADMGLEILSRFLEMLLKGPPQVYVPFFKQYYFTLLQDILSVVTDTLHKAGFKLQQHILLQLVLAVETGLLNEAAPKQRVMEFLFDVIGKSFPMLHRSQAEIFILNCFNKCRQVVEFKEHIRDFLIQLKEWGSHEDALYEDERQNALKAAATQESQIRMQVPGLVPQYDPARALEADMDDV